MSTKTAYEYAQQTMAVFWPNANIESTTVTRKQMENMLRDAFFAGKDEMMKAINAEVFMTLPEAAAKHAE